MVPLKARLASGKLPLDTRGARACVCERVRACERLCVHYSLKRATNPTTKPMTNFYDIIIWPTIIIKPFQKSIAVNHSLFIVQVPTSSQRDQDEDNDDGCVVVDCDEGGGSRQRQEEEEFDNDPYEEMEEEELPYTVEVEGDNNEVEIIMEEEPTGVDIPRQIQSGIPSSQQQQSEAISSAGSTGEPPSFASRSSRGIPPIQRQQQQHLLLVSIEPKI